MSAKNPHPHVKWRDGRPRFEPGRSLRLAGHKASDLRHDDGRWYSRGEAVDWSIRLPAVAARGQEGQAGAQGRPAGGKALHARPPVRGLVPQQKIPAAGRRGRARPPGARQDRLCAEDDPRLSPEGARRRGYDPSLWAAPVDALTTPVMFGLYEELLAERGVATARGAIAVVSVALAWGRKRGKFTFRMNQGQNPARQLDMATPPPRVRFATRAEISALVAAADAAGRPEVGDAVLLGLWTGQRQGDRLALKERGMLNGRRIFRQAKTGAIVAIRDVPELAARLNAASERRRAARAEALLAAATPEARAEVDARFAYVILDEAWDTRPATPRQRWQPFRGQHYTHVFAEIRAAAAKACPTLADFHEADLRDTAVTWMALAGAEIPEIISVTGHSPQSATQILKHYLATHPEMADEAMRKMVAWYDAGGETEIGL
jgi:hypothetical protein